MDELVDILYPLRFSCGFLISVSLPATDLLNLLDKRFDISLKLN